jgi:hypothetical protein
MSSNATLNSFINQNANWRVTYYVLIGWSFVELIVMLTVSLLNVLHLWPIVDALSLADPRNICPCHRKTSGS